MFDLIAVKGGNMRKKKLSILLSGALLVVSMISYITVQGDLFNESDAYIQTENIMNDSYVGSYVRSGLDNNAPVYVSDITTYAEKVIPSIYPSDISSYKKARPSRNQNSYGTCWAFSSIGLAESDLITKGQRDSSVDLSELQLIHFTYNSVTDPLSGTKGDYSKYYNDNASNSYLNKGGNYEMAVSGQELSMSQMFHIAMPAQYIITVLTKNMHMVMMWRICRMLI